MARETRRGRTEQRKRKIQAARDFVERNCEEETDELTAEERRDKFNEFFGHISAGTSPSIACARVSKSEQARNENLIPQIWMLCFATELYDRELLDIRARVGNGSNARWQRKPARQAEQLGASLLFEGVDRSLRAREYDPNTNRDSESNRRKLKAHKKATFGVTIETILSPDATSEEQRKLQTLRGKRIRKLWSKWCPQRERDRPKAILRDRLGPLAWTLYHNHDWSYGDIAKTLTRIATLSAKRSKSEKLCIPRATIQRWANNDTPLGKMMCKRWRKGCRIMEAIVAEINDLLPVSGL